MKSGAPWQMTARLDRVFVLFVFFVDEK